jgi:CO/xanthine dehydrogenase FAD-binding subunit
MAFVLHEVTVEAQRDRLMDLNTISEIGQPASRLDLPAWRTGDAWLAGGTWLFSEPQPALNRLIDLSGLNWPSLEAGANGLRIGATCTLAQLAAAEFPPDWRAAPVFRQCCRALLGSFKIWNAATVGGNLCMSLPAGPMAALVTAMNGVCTIWTPQGSERHVPAVDFIVGPQQNVLARGELLRAIDLPVAALRHRTAFRQISLTPAGRSAALVLGTLSAGGSFALTVTAATRRPIRLDFDHIVPGEDLSQAITEAIPESLYYDDLHGAPDWRRHMTFRFAEEIRQELAA